VNFSDFVQALQEVLPTNRVYTDDYNTSLYAQDVYAKGLPAGVVIRPENQTELIAAVKLANQHRIAMLPRGGGMSYTKGFVPVQENSMVIDMSAFNRVIEINEQDMFVTVEAGCTWQDLHLALKPSGLRTPYWGTLSGSKATVGGGLSQNSIFWGSGQHGFATDSVLSVEVVLANGDVVETGSAGQINSSAFCRYYGPDLTGIFCADNAALGIKTRITLKLIPQVKYQDGVSFCFESFEQQAFVMSAVARRGLASECCGFDPFLQAQRLQRESLTSDVKSLVGVMKNAGGIGQALKKGLKIAKSGRSFVEAEQWSVHFFVEDNTQAGLEEKLAAIREIASSRDANEIDNTIPTVLRANPFGPVNNMIGPQGERWVPVHTLVPHSKAMEAYQASCQVFEKHQLLISKYNIGIGYLLALVSTHVFVLEPVFFWPDELNELHHEAIDGNYLKKIKGFDANIEARTAVDVIRQDLIERYREIGGIHMQIGKTYQYQQGLAESNLSIVKTLKKTVDPNNVMNPGALGL